MKGSSQFGEPMAVCLEVYTRTISNCKLGEERQTEILVKDAYTPLQSNHRVRRHCEHSHLMNWPSPSQININQCMNSYKYRHQSESMSKINTFPLCIAKYHQPSFIWFNDAIRFILDTVYTLAAKGLLSRRKGNKIPCLVLFQDINFKFHCVTPLQSIKCFRESVKFRDDNHSS